MEDHFQDESWNVWMDDRAFRIDQYFEYLYASDNSSIVIFYGKISCSLLLQQSHLQSISWAPFGPYASSVQYVEKRRAYTSPKKYDFLNTQIHFLGFVVSANEVSRIQKKWVIKNGQNPGPSMKWKVFTDSLPFIDGLSKSLALL